MKVSIVIPAYNEEKRIGKTLKEYSDFFEKKRLEDKKFDYRVLVVINGTTDNTKKIVQTSMKKNQRITYLNLKAGGKGGAITEGFKESLKTNFDLIGFVDADLATSPKEYFKLIENIGTVDGAIANRYMRTSKIIPAFSFRRIIVSKTFNFIVRSLFFLPYTDTQCGAKLFKRKVVENITQELTITQWAFDIDLLYFCKKRKFKIKSIPTVWYEQEGGSLKIIKTSIGMFFAVLQLRLIKSRFKKLLNLFKLVVGLVYRILSK